MKKNYSILNAVVGMMIALCMTFGFQSCGQVDNPLEEIINTVSEKTGATPEEVSALIQSALSDEAVQQAIASGEPIKITVSSSTSTSSSDQTITIPMNDGLSVELTFTNGASTSDDNPLEFKAETGADADSGDSANELTIAMPDITGLVITIELPTTTVTLTTNGTSTVYKSVTAKTATNTLIIDRGVTVKTLILDGGSVVVNEGGEIETICMKAKGDDCGLTVGSYWASYGWGDPDLYGEGGEIKTPEINPSGNPIYYIPKYVRVEKGESSYIFVGTNGPNEECFDKLTIGDGLTTGVDNTSAKLIEGEGTSAKLSTRGWDSEGNFESHFSHNTQKVKNLAIAPEGAYTDSYIIVINYWGIEGYDGHNGGTFTFEDCSFPANTKFILATLSMTTFYCAVNAEWHLFKDTNKETVISAAGVEDTEVDPWNSDGYWTEEGPGYDYYTALKPTLVLKNCTIGGAAITNETGLIKGIWGNHDQNYKIIIDGTTYDHNMPPMGE